MNLPFFCRVDFGRPLVCWLGAHNKSFGPTGISVAISSRYKYRMTILLCNQSVTLEIKSKAFSVFGFKMVIFLFSWYIMRKQMSGVALHLNTDVHFTVDLCVFFKYGTGWGGK